MPVLCVCGRRCGLLPRGSQVKPDYPTIWQLHPKSIEILKRFWIAVSRLEVRHQVTVLGCCGRFNPVLTESVRWLHLVFAR